MDTVKLYEKPNRSKCTSPGDYWFAADGTVILSCPFCGHLGHCLHTILQLTPLTLTPSVIEHPCEHHFMVDNGFAIKV